MARHERKVLTRLLATTSLVALTFTVTPVVLGPHLGGAALSYAESGSSCFVAGTVVLMADGSARAIETLRAGDRVRGAAGRINRVVGIERPRLAGRCLYGFNGGMPFVTGEHPFLTMGGWKAVDPAATRRENATLKVAALRPGDLLTRARHAAPGACAGNLALDTDIAFWLEALTRIEAVAADPTTVVYNLLLDGDHSYIANGYVVHNKGGDDGGDHESGDHGGGDSGGGDNGGGDHSGGDNSGSGGGDDGGASGSSGEVETESGHGSGKSAGKEDSFFSGDPGAEGHDLSPDEEADIISKGWK